MGAAQVDEPTLEVPTQITIENFEKSEKNDYKQFTNVKDDVRWEQLPHLNPPGIKLIRRGKEKEYIATISKTGAFAGLYASWEPILFELERQKSTNGGRRTRHDDVGSGIHPELAAGETDLS